MTIPISNSLKNKGQLEQELAKFQTDAVDAVLGLKKISVSNPKEKKWFLPLTRLQGYW